MKTKKFKQNKLNKTKKINKVVNNNQFGGSGIDSLNMKLRESSVSQEDTNLNFFCCHGVSNGEVYLLHPRVNIITCVDIGNILVDHSLYKEINGIKKHYDTRKTLFSFLLQNEFNLNNMFDITRKKDKISGLVEKKIMTEKIAELNKIIDYDLENIDEIIAKLKTERGDPELLRSLNLFNYEGKIRFKFNKGGSYMNDIILHFNSHKFYEKGKLGLFYYNKDTKKISYINCNELGIIKLSALTRKLNPGTYMFYCCRIFETYVSPIKERTARSLSGIPMPIREDRTYKIYCIVCNKNIEYIPFGGEQDLIQCKYCTGYFCNSCDPEMVHKCDKKCYNKIIITENRRRQEIYCNNEYDIEYGGVKICLECLTSKIDLSVYESELKDYVIKGIGSRLESVDKQLSSDFIESCESDFFGFSVFNGLENLKTEQDYIHNILERKHKDTLINIAVKGVLLKMYNFCIQSIKFLEKLERKKKELLDEDIGPLYSMTFNNLLLKAQDIEKEIEK